MAYDESAFLFLTTKQSECLFSALYTSVMQCFDFSQISVRYKISKTT